MFSGSGILAVCYTESQTNCDEAPNEDFTGGQNRLQLGDGNGVLTRKGWATEKNMLIVWLLLPELKV